MSRPTLKNAKEIPLIGLDGEKKRRRDPIKRKREVKKVPYCPKCKQERRHRYNRVHLDAFGEPTEFCLEHTQPLEQEELF